MTFRKSQFRGRRTTSSSDAGLAPWFRGEDNVSPPWAALVSGCEEDLRREWDAVRDEILRDWITAHPGTRPRGWWLFDAPEPLRRRLGGIGSPEREEYAAGDIVGLGGTRAGVPLYWLDERRVESWGRGEAVDPQFPPIFESEATYLK